MVVNEATACLLAQFYWDSQDRETEIERIRAAAYLTGACSVLYAQGVDASGWHALQTVKNACDAYGAPSPTLSIVERIFYAEEAAPNVATALTAATEAFIERKKARASKV